jgi:hypothetical protein
MQVEHRKVTVGNEAMTYSRATVGGRRDGRDTPGGESRQWLTAGSAQPYCPYQSAA